MKYLNLYRFAGAVMYVMEEVFAMKKEFFIAPVDKKRGKTLLKEMLKGGNFGQHSGLTNHSRVKKYFMKNCRSLHFIRQYPAQAICEPMFRT